uniref:Putative RNA binding domain protein n=1 Tax=viral metagenome TaxID=1070528 RepID=A0A6M3LG00_9ZZZZ
MLIKIREGEYVNMSEIVSVSYDHDTQTLDVITKSGITLNYYEVEPDTVTDIVAIINSMTG